MDTAFSYGDAHQIISKSDKPFKIHTKIDSKSFKTNKVEFLKEVFQGKEIEVLYFHDPDSVRNTKLIEEVSLVLKSSKISLGLSIYSKKEFQESVKNKYVTFIQAPMNILNRQIDIECIRIGSQKDKKIVLRSILLQGLLTNNWKHLIHKTPNLKESIQKIERIAIKNKVTLEGCAIGWIMNFQPVFGIIIGVENINQLKSNHKLFFENKGSPELINDLKNIEAPNHIQVDPRYW